MKTIRYEWHWRSLSLWRETKETRESGGIMVLSGGSARIFTLNPKWLWSDFKDWALWKLGLQANPNPYADFEAFEKQWKREHPKRFLAQDDPDEFHKILTRYGRDCEAGTLVKLQPGFLK